MATPFSIDAAVSQEFVLEIQLPNYQFTQLPNLSHLATEMRAFESRYNQALNFPREIMLARKPKSAPTNENEFFVKELAGETPPSLPTMQTLYRFSSQLYEVRPWSMMGEDNLILIRDSITGETCYCSVMGQLGEVLGIHAYIGTRSYRTFRKLEDGEDITPEEFLASQHSVYVDFVPMEEMEVPDRKLLKALGHPRSAQVGPQFRTIRPGYYPWFVTQQEAQTLIGCLPAVFMICSILTKQGNLSYWERENVFPLVSETEAIQKEGGITEKRYRVDPVEVSLPPENPDPVVIDEEQLRRLRKHDHRMGGALELDRFLSSMLVGKKHDRKACIFIAMAADSQSGFLFPPEIADPGTPAPEALTKALIQALEVYRGLPQEVRVQSRHFKNYIQPIADVCGFTVKVVKSLPALQEARTAMDRMMGGAGRSARG